MAGGLARGHERRESSARRQLEGLAGRSGPGQSPSTTSSYSYTSAASSAAQRHKPNHPAAALNGIVHRAERVPAEDSRLASVADSQHHW